jgi:lipoate-protein ligase A
MALDVQLARSAKPTDSPILRLYQWRPWAISLGHHQSIAEIDLDRCRADGIDVVRRPTGGRAILHAEELTYSVVLPRACGIPMQTISSTYRLVSEALVSGLRTLGLDVTFGKSSRVPYQTQAPCFATSTLYEIQWRGRKLVGSAQRRYEDAVLQHGSILLGNAHLNLADYLRIDPSQERRVDLRHALRSRTATVTEAAGVEVPLFEVVEAVIRGFEVALGARFLQQPTFEIGMPSSWIVAEAVSNSGGRR